MTTLQHSSWILSNKWRSQGQMDIEVINNDKYAIGKKMNMCCLNNENWLSFWKKSLSFYGVCLRVILVI